MPGETSQGELSLKEKLVAARQENINKALEKDAEAKQKKTELREARKAERIARREAREAKFKAGVEKVAKAIKEARSWDRRMMLTLGAEIKTVPTEAKLTAKAGAEQVGKMAKKAGEWVDDRRNDIQHGADRISRGVERAVNNGIAATERKFTEIKTNVTNKFLETKADLKEGLEMNKQDVIRAWRRVEAVPYDIAADLREKRSNRIANRIDRDIAKYAEIKGKATESRSKANSLKGTSMQLAGALG